jgi:hypothetical protein
MHPTKRPRLEEVMQGLAAGDVACTWALADEFGVELARVVRRLLQDMGRRDVAAEPGRVEGLVLDIAFHLLDHGAAWDPAGGALPWVWAERAVRSLVARDVGHRCTGDDAEAVAADAPDGPPAPASDPTIDDLAAADPMVGLLVEAIARAGSDRDVAVHLEYGIQRACGDPSPAHTVAEAFGLKPDNVRQIDHRMRRKLRALADQDDRFRELGGLRWLA